MEEIRQKIKEIDLQLINLISKRMKLCKELGEVKKSKNLPIENKEREKALRKSWEQAAIEQGVSPDLIEKLWTIILDESIRMQR